MEHDAAKPVVIIPEVKGSKPNVKYQSAVAEVAARAVEKAPEIPQPAEVSAPPEATVQLKEDLCEMVKVTPRTTHARVRYGVSWFSFTANKPCLVPRHVAYWMQEKGIL